MFEKVVPKNLTIFTGTTLKPRFYDSKQPQNHAHERDRRGKGREGGEKRLFTHIFLILPTLPTRYAPLQMPRPRSIFLNNSDK